MAQSKDVSGNRYGKLIAQYKTGKDRFGIAIWRCVCDCGEFCQTRLGSLTSGATKSCGCLNEEVQKNKMIGNDYAKTHELSRHYLYQTWTTMKQRCTNPKHAKYYLYGGRGIEVCDKWMKSFPDFLRDMGDRPRGCTLNRIDNEGPYCEDNCEWQTYSEQNRNRRKYKRNKTGLFNEL